MGYATRQDMEARFGTGEIAAVAGADAEGLEAAAAAAEAAERPQAEAASEEFLEGVAQQAMDALRNARMNAGDPPPTEDELDAAADQARADSQAAAEAVAQEAIDKAVADATRAFEDRRIDAALADAAADIDATLATRYAVPLEGTWPRLVPLACDLARARLYDEDPPEVVMTRRTAARSVLKRLASGDDRLIDGAGNEAPRHGAATAERAGPEPIMTSDNLAGF